MSLVANGTHSNKKSASSMGKNNKTDLVTVEPWPMERLNWLIHSLHVRGDGETCGVLIRDEIENSGGKNEFAYYKKGVILREEGKIQESLETFQICHKLNPESADNFKEIGKCLYLLRRYRLSLEAYLEAEKLSTKPDWEIHHNLGECYVRLNDLPKAKEYTQKAVQMGKQEISYSLLIKILSAEGDTRSAVTICNSAVESCPDSINMLTKSGILYLKIGETQHAFERLSSALALDSGNPKALLAIGCITQNHGEYDVALSKYKLAVQVEPDSVALWNNIGMCFYAKQKYIAAITCLKRALWLSPLNWKVLLNLGLVNLSTNQVASSFNFLCAAVNIRPDIGLTFMTLGCALLELRDGENALRALNQALTLFPDDPLIIINTCLCLYLTGNKKEAVQLLMKVQNMPQVLKNNDIHGLCDKLDVALINELEAPEATEMNNESNDHNENVTDNIERMEDEV